MQPLLDTEVAALAALAKRANLATPDKLIPCSWFAQAPSSNIPRIYVCLVCGSKIIDTSIDNYLVEELIEHGREHLKNKNLLPFI